MDQSSLLFSALRRRMFPAMAAVTSVMIAAFAYLLLTPRQYETTSRLMINDKQLSVSDLGRDLASLPADVAGGANPLANQAELIKSKRVLEHAIAQISAKNSENVPTTGQLRQELRVKIIPATSILELSYRDQDPEMTATVLNSVMSSVTQENIEQIRAGARSVKEFLEAEVPKQRSVLEQAEEAEKAYRQASGLVSVEDQTQELVQNLGAAETQERELAIQLQDVATQNDQLKQLVGEKSRQTAYTTVRVGQDEDLKALRVKLDDLETQVIELRSRLGDQHPDLLALTEQRDEVRQLYERRLSRIFASQPSGDFAGDPLSQDLLTQLITSDIQRVALEQQLATVAGARQNLQARLQQLPAKQQGVASLARTRVEAESTLKQLQAKLQEARIAEAQLVSNIQIISSAEAPTQASWPKASSVLVTAAALAIALAVGIILLLECLDNAVHDVGEAEDLFGQPSLGSLPFLPPEVLNFKQRELFLDNVYLVEPYRKLLTTLKFRSSKRLRILVVSSAFANEGKSTVVSHLAAVSAMLSQRTLIVDADLHRPKQHKLSNLPLEPGLAEVVEGRAKLAQAIQPTSHDNLFILTRGKQSQRPSMLLESVAMKSLLDETSRQFDLVIVDTPPVNSCADALVLSRSGDGLLFVIRPEVTTRKGLSQAVGELNKTGVALMGFVANGVDDPISKDYFDADRDQPPSSNLLRRLPLLRALQRRSAISVGDAS